MTGIGKTLNGQRGGRKGVRRANFEPDPEFIGQMGIGKLLKQSGFGYLMNGGIAFIAELAAFEENRGLMVVFLTPLPLLLLLLLEDRRIHQCLAFGQGCETISFGSFQLLLCNFHFIRERERERARLF